jgi:DNA polymerase III alpha subunit
MQNTFFIDARLLSTTLDVPLQNTRVTLFQEQATRTATVGVGFVPSKADCLRRAMTTLRVSPVRAVAFGI